METILAGRYQIVRQLGGGGFGQTFLAKDSHLPGNPFCVVKQLKPATTDPLALETARRLFDREAETLYRLGDQHDQIPRLLAHFQQEHEFYLVQEYVEGLPLNQEFSQIDRCSEAEAIGLLQDILQVLAFVHQQNVIHRDIKPANLIRRSRDHKIVLIDFGAVKQVPTQAAGDAGQTNFTVAIGSPGYMPVEQQSFKPQFSSDLYAVGMVCLQALIGLSPRQLPRDAETGEFSCALVRDQVRISPGLAAILERMVRYDYRQRYTNATEALAALAALQQSDMTSDSTILTPTTSASPSSPPVSGGFSPAQTALPISASMLLENPEGQVPLNSSFYIERPPIELECFEAIAKPGALIRVKAARQMGKSSLMQRILQYSQHQGHQTAYLNFQAADAEFLTSIDQFLQWFCASVTNELNLEERLADFWKGVLGSKNKCTNYFQRYLLTVLPAPLTLGLDEVDQVFQHPSIAQEFFGLLRAWHERGKNEDLWKKLRLVIVHSKEVYIPLNINQSPFNVGLPIELPELTTEQVLELVKRHRLDWTNGEVEQLMGMVGGHPYLVRVALYEIASKRRSLEELLEVAPTHEGPYDDHLRRHLTNLKGKPDLINAIRQVITAEAPVQIGVDEAFQLRSMGLVKFQGNAVVPLCHLYCRYFRNHLDGIQ